MINQTLDLISWRYLKPRLQRQSSKTFYYAYIFHVSSKVFGKLSLHNSVKKIHIAFTKGQITWAKLSSKGVFINSIRGYLSIQNSFLRRLR